MKQTIQLTEAQFNQLVKECTEQILNEGAGWDLAKGLFRGIRDVNKANRADRRELKNAEKAERQSQKDFDNYMAQAEKDIQLIQQILSHYKGQPNSGNIEDKANRLIGAIRPKDASKADQRSYYSGQQNKVSQAAQNRKNAGETYAANKQRRSSNIQAGLKNMFNGDQQQAQSAAAE